MRRILRATLAGAFGSLLLASSALAGEIERVTVGGQAGRNETHGYSPQLFVDVPVVAAYVHVSNDGDGGDWLGPKFHATLKPDLGGDLRIGWGVTFSHVGTKAAARAGALRIGSWSIVDESTLAVPHVVGGVQVGVIPGVKLVTRAPGSNAAAYNSAVSISICRGHEATVHLSALQPTNDDPNPFGKYVTPDGTVVSQWNHDHVTSALDGVVLDGYLPLGRLRAKASGRVIRGTVTDCAGNPAPAVTVKTRGATARTSSSGAFTLHVRRAGSYSLAAAAGGGTVSAKVSVR
jgi:hypothetical protein